MSTPAIVLQQVAVVASGRSLLDIEELTIRAGERVAIVGANGAGKTTLLRLLSGFIPATLGSPQVLGRTVQRGMGAPALRALRAGVGQVLQGLHLVARLSAVDNVLMGGLARSGGWRSWLRWYPPGDVAEAQAALHAVGMLTRATTRADQLSGGERQKVAIARLLVQRPLLILADEPTASLDPAAALEVCKLLVQAARSATLITVVHNPALIPLIADRVIGLKQGRIVFDVATSALQDQQLTDLYRSNAQTPAAHWQLGSIASAQAAVPTP